MLSQVENFLSLKHLKVWEKFLQLLSFEDLKKNILIASTAPWTPLTFLRYSWVSSSYRNFLYAF